MGTTLTPTVLIDGVDIENEMGARLKSEYTVTGIPITNEYIQGETARNLTFFPVYGRSRKSRCPL